MPTDKIHHRSPFALGLGVLGAVVGLVAWVQTGHLANLLGALAFALFALAWYHLPITLRGPIVHPVAAAKSAHFPVWAAWLTGLGMVLLCASIALRVLA